MNEDAAYTVFLIFGLIWIGLGIVAVIALFRLENQPLKFGKWGLLVTLTILIPFVTALAIAALMSWKHITFLPT